MTENDKALIEIAQNFKIIHWRLLLYMIEMADSQECQEKLKEIIENLLSQNVPIFGTDAKFFP